MKKLASGALLASFLFGIAVPAWADNAWVGYTGVDRSKPQHRPPSRPHYAPQPPHSQRPYYPQRPSHGGYYPPAQSQSGFNIQYQAPTMIYQNSNSYSWVNGDPNVAYIESSRYTVITDWQRLGLPAPPRGSYWIYENGRYVLMNDR